MDGLNMGLAAKEYPNEELEALSGMGKEVGCDLDGKNTLKGEGSPIPVQKSIKEKEAEMVEN